MSSVESVPAEAGKESVNDVITEPRKERILGVADVKEEFIIHDYKPRLEEAYVSQAVKRNLDAGEKDAANKTDEPPNKKVKLKGQNKRKMKDRWREENSEKLCVTILTGKGCSYGEKCRFKHDLQSYLDTKMPNLDGECPSYRILGRCQYGITCRYSHDHFHNMRNLVNEELLQENQVRPKTRNILSRKLMNLLRKHSVSFTKSDIFFKANGIKPSHRMMGPPCERSLNIDAEIGNDRLTDLVNKSSAPDKSVDTIQENFDESCARKTETSNSSNDVKIPDNSERDVDSDKVDFVCHSPPDELRTEVDSAQAGSCQAVCTIENNHERIQENAEEQNSISVTSSVDTGSDRMEIRLRPQEKRKIDFRDKLYLAPLTTVGNLPFRVICKQYGADITCGEMALATNILQGKHSEWALLKRHHTEDLFGVQLCGGHADSMTRCAELINTTCDVDFVDINVGCPIDLIFKKGGGSALMERSRRLGQIVRGMSDVMDIPLTVKMRTGVWEDRSTAHELIPQCREWGADLVTLHGRSREQRYTKRANWEYIGRCVQAAGSMPVFGNGDVMSYEDYESFRATSGVAGAMIARGALIKPWVFTELKERRHWDIRSSERLEMLRDFVRIGLSHWGSDPQGVETTRRFLLEWLSFLCRYVPVGLLEHVPQRINERPPAYRGRDDLETMMASGNCADWIKISEMLLGPVPAGFVFLPKHKANAYK